MNTPHTTGEAVARSAQGVPDSGKGPGLYPGRKKGECSRRGCRWHVWCSCWGGRALPQQHGGISTPPPPPPQPFHPWQILFLLNPTKRGSSFHSSQWCLSWLGTVSLCLPRQKVRPSPKNSMAGKGKTVSLCCLSSPALSLDLPALRGQPKGTVSDSGTQGAAAAHAVPAGPVLAV